MGILFEAFAPVLSPSMMSDSETLLAEDAVSRQGALGRTGKVMALTAALLLAVVAAAATSTMVTIRMVLPQRGVEHGIASLNEMLAVKPAYENCAQVADDCLAAACCAPTGFNCFENAAGKGVCMRECTPGGQNGTCRGVAPHMKEAVELPGLSFFCFAVYTQETGSDKLSHELGLLQMQHDNAWSLFSCAEWAVYSDVKAPLGGDDFTIPVEDKKQDFHILKRTRTQTWVNTGMFDQVWQMIKDAGHYKNHNWVIKVDADAVFFPLKLGKVLQDVRVPEEGLYFENCKFVDWGYFGNLEVFSKQAFETLVDSMERCYNEIPWKVGVHGGKYGPMGEDLFAQKCMDLVGVSKQENFGLTTDGACESDRPEGEKKNRKYSPNCAGVSSPSIHPFKEPSKYAECWHAAKDFQP